MRTDIIIPTFRQEDFTVRCMRSLRQHTADYRLIWVDNGSGAKSRDFVMGEFAHHPGSVQLWMPENQGFIKAVNTGLRLILNRFTPQNGNIVLLNNDVEVTAGWLDRMTRVLERDLHVKAVGPVTGECSSWQSYVTAKMGVPVFQTPDGFEMMNTEERAAKLDYCYGDLFGRCRMLAFFCTLFRREVFQKVGLLDERFGVGLGDDDDLCRRMKAQNMICALSMGTYVFHNHRTTFKALYSEDQLKAMQEERKQTFMDKHGEEAKV